MYPSGCPCVCTFGESVAAGERIEAVEYRYSRNETVNKEDNFKLVRCLTALLVLKNVFA